MPFFSIGLTTFNRKDYLKRSLDCLLGQTFPDFEVLVGNDYTAEILDAETLGISDPRVRFINHPANLGEAGNQNALLKEGQGRYFTWHFDDDLVASDFLERVHAAIEELKFPDCVFSSYSLLHETSPRSAARPPERYAPRTALPLSGREFLRGYFEGRLKVMGCNGVFETERLRQIGGVERLCQAPVAFHSEYLLLIKTGLFERIGFLDLPLVFFRVNPQRALSSYASISMFKEAGINYLSQSARILASPPLVEDFRKNFASVLRLTMDSVVGQVYETHRRVCLGILLPYLCELHRCLPLGPRSAGYWQAVGCLLVEGARWVALALREWIRRRLPQGVRLRLRRMRGDDFATRK